MPSELIRTITSGEADIRNRSLEELLQGASAEQMLAYCDELDRFRRTSDNLYERVRALFFLYAIHRYHLPTKLPETAGLVPFNGYGHLLSRRFEEAIDVFLQHQRTWLASVWKPMSCYAAAKALDIASLGPLVR